ncbi:LOW QUALITY PROTEIN: Reverse transcriptase [Phytophthora palmivora]|uniref:Reverse transcriptase n=1 Tax=Phytophthora palmivora TaxID=4796 RepID=A0A2P4WXQ4_9STRA|nr:LOW QUALITY PROTEIN: Reverse transcriptase [Phytophthora palmivora]
MTGSLVYSFDIWVGDLAGQDAILGMDFMVPTGLRLDLAYGSISLPDEVRIQLSGHRQLYSDKARLVTVGDHIQIEIGQSLELQLRLRMSDHEIFWVIRGSHWVPTVVKGLGKRLYLQITNISDKTIILQEDVRVGIWLEGDHIPRMPGFVSIGSRRYMEWQNLALEATVERGSEQADFLMESTEPMVDRPLYPSPRAILKRPEISQIQVSRSPLKDTEEREISDRLDLAETSPTQVDPASRTEDQPPAKLDPPDLISDQPVEVEVIGPDVDQVKVNQGVDDLDLVTEVPAEGDPPRQVPIPAREVLSRELGNPMQVPSVDLHPVVQDPTMKCGDQADPSVSGSDPNVHYHESVDLPRVGGPPRNQYTTDEVKIEDIQVGDPENQTSKEMGDYKIWKYRHLLIGKGNALPPAARGVVCDIDVDGAKPIVQRVRKIAPRCREKLSDLIKGLLSAKMTNYSRSPWASPIVVKNNGIDIRLCIDYRLVNSLTQLMVYPMPLINDLLEDLDKILWYCSLDMASGFWVVTMTDRARAISAFITPFGLFEWNRMPFGLCATDLPTSDRQRFVWIHPDPAIEIGSKTNGRRIAEISCVIGWTVYWSVVKSFWGMSKVEYLGHRISKGGLEANLKDLKALTDLTFPGSLRSMQSFLGSLNYYRRFIEDYAIYTVVLYELREVDFAVMSKGM